MGSDSYVRNIDLSRLPVISVDGVSIPYVDEARNLGVMLSISLSWESQVRHVSRKVHFSIHKLKFHRNVLSRDLRATLITSLIFPIIDYCCLVYHGLTNELDLRLQRLINCGIRFVYDLRKDVHITPCRRQLGRLSVRDRRNDFLGIAMYNVYNHNAPSFIFQLFERVSGDPVRSRRRSLPTYIIPQHRTESYRRSFAITGMCLWEPLPTSVTSSPTLSIFKDRLYTHLFADEVRVPAATDHALASNN